MNDEKLTKWDIDLVMAEKQQIIRKSGILEFYPTDTASSEIGGLTTLKKWLEIRNYAFSNEAKAFGLPSPRGALLLGAPGCGKSLTAKAVAHLWKLPLIKLDFGKIFSGLVGSSEENLRRGLMTAERISPAVLWIDELEKGLSGGTQGSLDSGTAARVFGTFLTWMQEKKGEVFVIATANRIEMLPPELLRKGRFDEIFFVDLPQEAARRQILEIHIKKRSRDPKIFDLGRIIGLTEGFSGAELEHIIIEGLFLAFAAQQELASDHIIQAAQTTVPLSRTYAEELNRLRTWAADRARPAD